MGRTSGDASHARRDASSRGLVPPRVLGRTRAEEQSTELDEWVWSHPPQILAATAHGESQRWDRDAHRCSCSADHVISSWPIPTCGTSASRNMTSNVRTTARLELATAILVVRGSVNNALFGVALLHSSMRLQGALAVRLCSVAEQWRSVVTRPLKTDPRDPR